MSRAINLLLVEDSEDDAALVVRVLARGGFEVRHARVESAAAMEAALREQAWDVVVSDFNLPGFNGLAALRMLGATGLDIPFILISGTVGEEIAVDALKAGANDYIVKRNLSRLASVVERELHEAEIRAEHRQGQRKLVESEAGLRRAQAMAGLSHVITGPDGSFESWSESLPRLIGVEPQQMPKSTREWLRLIHADDQAAFRATSIEAGRRGTRMSVEYRIRHSGGAWLHIFQVLEPIDSPAGKESRVRWFNTLQDVTAQKIAEETLRASEERHRAMFEQAAVGIVHSGLDGSIQMANSQIGEMTGYPDAELLRTNIRDLTDPEDMEKSISGRARMLSGTGTSYAGEVRLVRKDGTRIWTHVTTSLVRGADGRPSSFISVLSDISERKRAEQDLQRFRMAMDVTADSIYLTDPATMRFVYLNDAACRRLRYTREQLMKLGPLDVLPITSEELERDYAETLAAGEQGWRRERPFIRSDGSEGWTELQRRALVASDTTLIVTIGRDITERKAQQERIVRLSRVQAVLSRINSLIVRVSEREELFREACRIAVEAGRFKMAWLGVVDREAMRVVPIAWQGVDEDYVRRMPLDLADAAPGAQGLVAAAFWERKAMVSDDMTKDPRIVLKKEALERGFRSLVILPLAVGGEVVGMLALYSEEAGIFDEEELTLLRELAGDIAFALDHIEKENKLDYLAYYDSLTGLANRTLFHDRVGQYVHSAHQAQGKLALVIADVERFRNVNDSLGRMAGDELLRQLAERLGRATNPADIGRISGDQFAIVLPEIRGRSQIGRTIENVWRDCFATPFQIDGMDLRISAKAGIAMFPNDGADAETLFSRAEAALQMAKRTGERYVFHSRRLTAHVSGQLSLENKLRQALEKEEFVLHYQPKVDLESRAIVGVEALIRWNSPTDGLVPPGRFIPLLEETGLILEVGAWALRRAVLDHGNWMQQGITPPRIAVNVSSIQLRQRDFVDVVRAAVSQGAHPTGIDLEITESLMMEDVEGNIQKLKAVRDLGMKIAIDDFGTGYSSLSYLAKLPVNSLKIDRSFIITMLNDPAAMSLVQMIITLAHSLRLAVIAEGVEEEDQAKMLRLLRCDQMQGYLFSRPIPAEQLTPLLRTDTA